MGSPVTIPACYQTPMGSPAGQSETEEPISPKELLASLESKLDKLDADMRLLDDEIWDLSERMPKHSMLAQLGFCKKSQASETDVGKLAELQKQFKELEREADEVANQLAEIRLQEQEKEDAMLLIPELIVIAFVNELEKADQYFDFKDYLKRKNNITKDSFEIDVVKELLKEETRKKFDKLDETSIRHAISADILEKRFYHAPAKYIEYLKKLDSGKWEWESSNVNINVSMPTEEYSGEKDGNFPNLELRPEEMDRYAFTHPICHLVFLTRHKHNVMNQNPEEELKKIEKFDSVFFNWDVQLLLPRKEFEKIMSTYKDTSCEEALCRVRTELYDKALAKYNAITKKYSLEDEVMWDCDWKRSSPSGDVGESSQPRRSVRTRIQPRRSVRTRTRRRSKWHGVLSLF